MPVVTFACPECGKVLKSAQPIPAGKKIKCPGCAAVFPMPAQDDDEVAAGISAKPRRSAAAAPPRDDEDEADRPRRKASRAADAEDEDEPRPRRRTARDEEEDGDEPRSRRQSRDDDEEDEDDRPRRKKKTSAKRRRSGGGGGKGLLIAAVAVVVLLLMAGGGVGVYFIWFSGVNNGSGNEDPLAYVPPGTEALIGVDFATLLDDPTLGPLADRAMRQQAQNGDFIEACRKETGLEFKELCARAVICTNLDTLNNGGLAPGPMPPAGGVPRMGPGGGGMAPGGAVGPRKTAMTMILRPSRPFDQKKVARSCKNPVRKTAHGKTYYEVNDGDVRTVFMPSDRTLILSTQSGAELDALFNSDGTTPSVSADTVALARGVDKTTYWLVLPFEGQTRTKVNDMLAMANQPGNPMKPLADQVGKGKGMAAWADLQGNQVNFGASLACADAASATQVVQGIDQSWKEQKGQAIGGVGLLALGAPKLGKVLSELLASLKFTAEGTLAKMSAGAARATLADAVTEIQQKNGGGFMGGLQPPGAGGGGPQPPGPGGASRPGRRPGQK